MRGLLRSLKTNSAPTHLCKKMTSFQTEQDIQDILAKVYFKATF
jgi:hypothetical protein